MSSDNKIKDDRKVRVFDSSGLSDWLEDLFDDAYQHKSDILCRFTKDELQHAGVFDQDMVNALIENGEPHEIHIPLGGIKARAQTAWILDTLENAVEEVFTIQPTPFVALSEEHKRAIRARFDQMLNDKNVEFGDLTIDIVDELIDEAVVAEISEMYRSAEERARRMAKQIQDQFIESGMIETLHSIVYDLEIYSAAVAKAIVPLKQRRLTWASPKIGGSDVRVSEIDIPSQVRVDPNAVFPTPDVTHDPNTGTGIFEYATITGVELERHVDIFDEAALDSVLDEHPIEYIEERNPLCHANSSRVYSVLRYYGYIPAEFVEVDSDDGWVHVEVWMINGRVILIDENPDPLNRTPFLVIPRTPKNGEFWGGPSLQTLVEPYHRLVNSLTRQVIINVGYASGVYGEYDRTRVDSSEIKRRANNTLLAVGTGLHGERAIRLENIPLKAPSLLAMAKQYEADADAASGIPAYIAGSPTSVDNPTYRQTEFAYQQASKGLLAIFKSIDANFINPLVVRMYEYNMRYSPNEFIKGDAQADVRGLSGVFVRDIKRKQAESALGLLTTLQRAVPSYVNEDSVAIVMEEVLRKYNIDPQILAKSPTHHVWGDAESQAQQQQISPQVAGVPTQATATEDPTNEA